MKALGAFMQMTRDTDEATIAQIVVRRGEASSVAR